MHPHGSAPVCPDMQPLSKSVEWVLFSIKCHANFTRLIFPNFMQTRSCIKKASRDPQLTDLHRNIGGTSRIQSLNEIFLKSAPSAPICRCHTEPVSATDHSNLSPEPSQIFLLTTKALKPTKSPLTCYPPTSFCRDSRCLVMHGWQPEDRALEIAQRFIYSIELPCQLVTCRPRDAIVSYQTSDWTTEEHLNPTQHWTAKSVCTPLSWIEMFVLWPC